MAQDRSRSIPRATEALWFWENAIEVRHGPDKLVALDALLTIGKCTEWPLLAVRCADALQGPRQATG